MFYYFHCQCFYFTLFSICASFFPFSLFSTQLCISFVSLPLLPLVLLLFSCFSFSIYNLFRPFFYLLHFPPPCRFIVSFSILHPTFFSQSAPYSFTQIPILYIPYSFFTVRFPLLPLFFFLSCCAASSSNAAYCMPLSPPSAGSSPAHHPSGPVHTRSLPAMYSWGIREPRNRPASGRCHDL